MSASSPQNAVVSRPSSEPSPTSNPAWLETLLFNAKMITAGAEALPFPYVKVIVGPRILIIGVDWSIGGEGARVFWKVE
ncbi:hypothetical protein C8R44DRAFT_877669 [Mycena epipterygia]|nr:hypothetical protein C8R44DRAFT_877669 [Mycena epipterygia]